MFLTSRSYYVSNLSPQIPVNLELFEKNGFESRKFRRYFFLVIRETIFYLQPSGAWGGFYRVVGPEKLEIESTPVPAAGHTVFVASRNSGSMPECHKVGSAESWQRVFFWKKGSICQELARVQFYWRGKGFDAVTWLGLPATQKKFGEDQKNSFV